MVTVRWPCILIGALCCLLTVAAQDGSAQARMPQKISGYGGYRFGMTVAEAHRAEPGAAEVKCQYVGAAFCLQHESVFLGVPGRVDALFADEDKRLFRVNIMFDRLESTEPAACKNGVKAVGDALFGRFGKPTKTTPRNAFWYAPEGGEIQLVNLCFSDQTGMFIVSYSPSAGDRDPPAPRRDIDPRW
jgi:hypothetical protein